jgi:hypothetical protein
MSKLMDWKIWASILLVMLLTRCYFGRHLLMDGNYETTDWKRLIPVLWDEGSTKQQLILKYGKPDGKIDYENFAKDYRKALDEAPAKDSMKGKKIKIAGYVVPLDFKERNLTEFLLIPNSGGCMHTPPPPANQVIYVKYDKGIGIEYTDRIIWIYGQIEVKKNDNNMAIAGYEMTIDKMEEYSQQPERK